ncbi:MAG: hypothetical protein K8H86_04720 [Ignavibacteriaceae bacterium]|nr:hypothetical protein [Ignavibacteriaceae bacterium]
MIDEVFDALIIILSFTLFGVLHSYLASLKVKQYLANRLGKHMAFYRIFYNVISFVMVYFIYDLTPRPDVQLYSLSTPFDIIIMIPQLLSIVGLLWTLKYFSGREFLGINQVFRWFYDEYDTKELDEHLTLRIGGPYKYTRHPIYFFSITLLLFRAEMNLYYLIFLICIALYFLIGSIYEEKKLVIMFGDAYSNYQKKVPRIIPTKLFNPYKTY